MGAEFWIAGILAVLILFYLIYVIINAEDF